VSLWIIARAFSTVEIPCLAVGNNNIAKKQPTLVVRSTKVCQDRQYYKLCCTFGWFDQSQRAKNWQKVEYTPFGVVIRGEVLHLTAHHYWIPPRWQLRIDCFSQNYSYSASNARSSSDSWALARQVHSFGYLSSRSISISRNRIMMRVLPQFDVILCGNHHYCNTASILEEFRYIVSSSRF